MRWILCIWPCWKTDSLNLKFMDEHLSRIQYRPVHLYRGRPSQKSVLTVVACSGDLYNYQLGTQEQATTDRKSTRLNSSHLGISYAVFCLKKKNRLKQRRCTEQQSTQSR